MLDTFYKLYRLLDRRERRKALLLFGMMLVMGLLETTGVASVMPFISVVADPRLIDSNDHLSALYKIFDFSSTDTFVLFLGIFVFFLILGSLVFKAFTYWAVARFSHMRNFSLSCRLLKGYLNRPYSWFLNRHSADLGKTILSEVQYVVGSALMPGLQIVANSVVAAFLITLVILVEPMVALVAGVILGGAYAIIYAVLRKYLSIIGDDRVRANQERFQIAQEALGGIKDVKVMGLERGYIRSFREPARRFAKHQASSQIVGELPQFALQALVFGGILALLLTLLASRDGDLGAVLPLMALYAFAGYRLMPALQNVYKALSQLRFGKPALDALYQDMVTTGVTESLHVNATEPREQEPIHLRQKIVLSGVSYTYPNSGKSALEDFHVSIQAKTTVAFVGTTGAGKTTAVDCILGLLVPQRGEVKVDDTVITPLNVRAWQKSVGYVPQHVFLTDDTIAANIAFGVSKDEWNFDVVEQAARNAELHEFIINELPAGYRTMIGERGVRLSGGQRQRIGIARALYHDPDVLVLDEATSALDNLTEKAVMDAVHNLGHRKTIIIIAHRLSTVRNCDTIFLLEHGKLIAKGSYDELRRSSSRFRALSALAV